MEAPVTPARWVKSKKSMVRVGGVLDDAWRCRPQAAYMVNVLSGGQLGAGDPLGSFHHPLEFFTV